MWTRTAHSGANRHSLGPSGSRTSGKSPGTRSRSARPTSRGCGCCATAPAGLEIAAGEYAYVAADFRNLIVNGCVDCLQADVTRCGGITGFLRAGALAAAFDLDLSAHCAPSASVAACCAVPNLRHLEYFHDHVRLERMLFDGVLEPQRGALQPDRSRQGNGLELKRADAERFAA